MSKQNGNSESNHSNPVDEFLNQNQEGEISRPESVEEEVFAVKADALFTHRTTQVKNTRWMTLTKP
jgi:hypothetical protein